jgi:2-isopropylmalate synthase
VNCHDHLGLAVANSLAAVAAGARQVECAVNGTGERAGNAALEQIAMILKICEKAFPLQTGIGMEQIHRASCLISTITGIPAKSNRALMGATAVGHRSREHADRSSQHRTSTEIMSPVSVGIGHSSPLLVKHSGRRAFEERVTSLGYQLTQSEIKRTFTRFKELAGKKETVYDEDIEAIIAEEVLRNAEKYKLISVTVMSGSDVVPTAKVWMEIDGKRCHGAELGNGPVDATFNAICKLTGRMPKLLDFSITSITGGTDALGHATIRVEEGGNLAAGQGSHEDLLVATARAVVNALNRLDFVVRKREVIVQS